MLKGVINGKINRCLLFISFSTSVLKSVINVWIIVLNCCYKCACNRVELLSS